MTTRDFYKVLQVDHEAEHGVIEAAFRHLARTRHPDLNRAATADRQMAELNRAFQVLRDPALRAEYDNSRKAAAGAARPAAVHVNPTPAPSPPAAPSTARARWSRSATSAPPAEPLASVDFGRYAGWTLEQLARHDPDYLQWLRRHSSGLRFRPRIDELLQHQAQQQEAAAATGTGSGRRR